MHEGATAGIEFFASSMRYAEVEHLGDRYRLLRLGNCDFEFDVADVLFGDGSTVYLNAIAQAVGEVFDGSSASTLRVTLHSPTVVSFVSGRERDVAEDLKQDLAVFDAGIVTGSKLEDDLVRTRHEGTHVSTVEEDIEMVHVSALEATYRDRLNTALSRLAIERRELISESESISRVIRVLPGKKGHGNGTVLTVGMYHDHVSYSVFHDGDVIFSQDRAETNLSDITYFCALSLRHAGSASNDVADILVYGDAAGEHALNSLSAVFPGQAEMLNPIGILNLSKEQFADDFAFHTIVSCLGATL